MITPTLRPTLQHDPIALGQILVILNLGHYERRDRNICVVISVIITIHAYTFIGLFRMYTLCRCLFYVRRVHARRLCTDVSFCTCCCFRIVHVIENKECLPRPTITLSINQSINQSIRAYRPFRDQRKHRGHPRN